MKENQIESVCPASRQQWRKWLQKNHDKRDSVWLIYYKKESKKPTVTWVDAVEEALCFGWIDSTKKAIDSEKFMQRFSRRKSNSMWSKINKDKVQRLIEDGLMTPAGLRAIETARQNGSWSVIDEVEKMTIPKDLDQAFKKRRGSKKNFLAMSRSQRRILLVGLVMSKRPETRAKRIAEIVEFSSKEGKP